MRLNRYTLGSYTPGAPRWQQLLWYFLGFPLVESRWFPVSAFKVWILRWFGARIGQGVRIKPGVRVKFPWRLSIGDYVWIGENTWLDNVAAITLDSHVCLSQGVYFCTGNHNWNRVDFQLTPRPIWVQQGSWIAARAVVGPGVTIGRGAVLCLGGVAVQSLEPMTIYAGNPARAIKLRSLQDDYKKIERHCPD